MYIYATMVDVDDDDMIMMIVCLCVSLIIVVYPPDSPYLFINEPWENSFFSFDGKKNFVLLLFTLCSASEESWGWTKKIVWRHIFTEITIKLIPYRMIMSIPQNNAFDDEKFFPQLPFVFLSFLLSLTKMRHFFLDVIIYS